MKRRNMMKAMAITCMIGSVLGSSLMASAETNDLKSLPSPLLVSFAAGKTFDAKIGGYGWGEEDDASSLGLDLVIVEPLIYAADEVEALEKGDLITAGYEVYTVDSAEAADGSVTVTAQEEWLTPLTFTKNEEGNYIAENEEGVLQTDSFSFRGSLGSDLVYVNADGEELTALELIKDLSSDVYDTYDTMFRITFDEAGFVTKVDFS